LFKKKGFEFRVKLMRGQGKKRRRIRSSADGGAEGYRSCFGREFQSTGTWWVKDLSISLRRERTEGRCRVMTSEPQRSE